MMNIANDATAGQLEEWSNQLRALAAKLSAAKGRNCALLLVSATTDGYDGEAAEIIVADALRVLPYGWPDGFTFELFNASQCSAARVPPLSEQAQFQTGREAE